jgi:hypothetical protein
MKVVMFDGGVGKGNVVSGSDSDEMAGYFRKSLSAFLGE